jgi:Zn finger protein HypA/HybF involved in hydrogenase expression
MVCKLSQEEFIMKSNIIHNNYYDYSKTIYTTSNEKILITCPIHGDFIQKALNHLYNRQGCPQCAVVRRTKTKEKFILDSFALHGGKYDYSNILYIDSHTHIIIGCKKHGEFSQTPANHLQGSGCTFCAIENASTTNDEFVKYATIKHNKKFDYSDVIYKNSKIKITIKCLTCNSFFTQLPLQHLTSIAPCPVCSGRNKTTEQFIIEAKSIHGGKYDYSTVNYIKGKEKVKILCKTHNEYFSQTPESHLRGRGCPKCVGRFKTTKDFIKDANIVHNNYYDYSETVYRKAKDYIIVTCFKHGPFQVTADHHLHGQGCSTCNSNISNKEVKWLDELSVPVRNKILIINKKRYKVDGYNPNTNTVYEFYGDYFHGNPEVYKACDYNKKLKKLFGELYNQTIERECEIKNAGFNLITIWEKDWDEYNKK